MQFKVLFCPRAAYFLTISNVNYMHADMRKISRRSWMHPASSRAYEGTGAPQLIADHRGTAFLSRLEPITL